MRQGLQLKPDAEKSTPALVSVHERQDNRWATSERCFLLDHGP